MTIPLNALRLTLLVCAATMTVLTGGCGQKKVAVQAALPQQIDQQDRLEESLFKGDTDVLSNTDIERILSARVTTADRHRMAVLGGIVAHTARSAEAIDMKKATGDLNFSETVAKAESEATGRALVKLAESVVSYLRDGK